MSRLATIRRESHLEFSATQKLCDVPEVSIGADYAKIFQALDQRKELADCFLLLRRHMRRLMTHNVRAEPRAAAGADWPRKDNDNDGLERPGGACRCASA